MFERFLGEPQTSQILVSWRNDLSRLIHRGGSILAPDPQMLDQFIRRVEMLPAEVTPRFASVIRRCRDH